MEPLENRTVPSAAPIGPQFLVNPRLPSPENSPAVAVVDSAGDFVAVWQSFEQDGSGFGIYAKLMHPDGTYIGSPPLLLIRIYFCSFFDRMTKRGRRPVT